nr:activating transcription factor 7-interacting protein 2 [Cavia porcellus]
MASLDRSKRRILKAKKTMPPSCRRQAEILNKSKTIEVLKTATINSNVPSNNQNLSTEVITGECVRPEIVDSSLDSKINSAFLLNSIAFPQNLIKPVEKFVHSETRFDEQIVCSYKKPRKAIDSSSHFFIQEVKEQWNTSETHFEYKANVTSSYFQDEQNCNLKSICHSPTMLRDLVQNPLDNNRINKMASNLEVNSSSDSYDEMQNDILSSSSCYMPVVKTPNLVNLVISNNCASNTLKTKESSKTQHSSISDVENTESKWQCLLNTGGNNSYNQKKMFSENKENVKHMKTSEQINENICVALERQTAVLEQVKHLIQQEIYSINFKLFDKKVKELNERIKKTQCRQKHEAIAGELFLDSKRIISANSNISSNDIVEVRDLEKRKCDFVIDLTKEGPSTCKTESPVFSLESPSKAALNSREITPVAESATEDLDCLEHLPPLPEASPPLPELVYKIGDTLPPQKPELKVKWVLKPMSIALTWNITKVSPRCAPVESYHLFLCHENANNKLVWKKIAEIKALPLPMGCTLSEFFASSRYYFTIQSKDIFGRYGPFCDIKSLPGFCDSLI